MNDRSQINRIVVIGGGISGLATAALLAKSGWKVTLLEKNSSLGGRARVLKTKGFAFDMGPSWYMMPEIFEDFFELFNKKPEDFYNLVRLNPRYQVFWGDGTNVLLTDDSGQNSKIFENIEKGSGRKLKFFLNKQKKIYDLATQNLVKQDMFELKNFVNFRNIKDLASLLINSSFWKNWHQEIKANFKNPKLQQLLEFHSVFLGGAPENTPGIFSLITSADFERGIWYPVGGMGKVVQSLVSICEEQGVEIRTNCEVRKMKFKEKRIVAVETKDETYSADCVVAATDLPSFELKLLPENLQTYSVKYWKKKTLGISALLIYLGIDKKIKNIPHHSLYFSTDWKQNFEDIFKKNQIPGDPSFYISARTATDTTIAPNNNEELFILVPLGSRTSYSDTELNQLAEKVISKTESILRTKIRNRLQVKRIYTPSDFEKDYNAYNGTALGLAHTWTQSLWGRPGNKSKKIKNLYYAGQYTNPGVGVPMALISGQIVAKKIGAPEKAAQNIFKRGSTTYYNSSRFFKGQIRDDVFSLYAYVRTIDDFVDNQKPELKLFEEFWENTKNSWNGRKSGDLIVDNFVELARRKEFEWEWIEAFWSAMRADLKVTQYKKFVDLENYMFGSAEVIGLMMCRILYLPSESYKAAQLQGKAMQFLNFIRDVKEDKQMGRNYLGYSEAVTRNPEMWSEFIRKKLDNYFKIQKKAEEGYKFIPREYLIPIKTAADMYKWTAVKIYRDPMVVWDKKVKPNKYRVGIQMLFNWLR